MPLNIVISSDEVTKDDFNLPANGGSEPIVAQQNAVNNISKSNETNVFGRSVYASMVASFGMQQAKSLIDYSINHYGDFTGNYEGQARFQEHISNASAIANVSMGVGQIALGVATFNPVAVIGGTMQLTSLAINTGKDMYEYQRNLSKSNVVATYNSRRIGSILTNGNR